MNTAKRLQGYGGGKGFAEVGTEEWLRECEALLQSVPEGANTVLIGKDRLKGLVERVRELQTALLDVREGILLARKYRELEQAGTTDTACPWCGV